MRTADDEYHSESKLPALASHKQEQWRRGWRRHPKSMIIARALSDASSAPRKCAIRPIETGSCVSRAPIGYWRRRNKNVALCLGEKCQPGRHDSSHGHCRCGCGPCIRVLCPNLSSTHLLLALSIHWRRTGCRTRKCTEYALLQTGSERASLFWLPPARLKM